MSTVMAAPVPAAPAAKVNPAEEAPEVQKLTELFESLTTVADAGAKKSAAEELATLVKNNGHAATAASKVAAALDGKATKEAALIAYAALLRTAGRQAEPQLVALLPKLLENLADKAAPVRAAAEDALEALRSTVSPHAVPVMLPMVFESMTAKKWQTQLGAIQLLAHFTQVAPRQIAINLPEVVPKATAAMGDARENVRAAAVDAANKSLFTVGNRDIEPFIPILVSCMQKPDNVPDCVHKLASTTFVQTVEAPTLSIMAPLLQRGLRQDQPTAIKRKCAVIIENMSKLVENPADAAPFLPKLLPLLERVANEVADPECRSVASRAHAVLLRTGNDGKATPITLATSATVMPVLKEIAASRSQGAALDQEALTYAADLCATLINIKEWEFDEWNAAVTPALIPALSETDAEAVTRAFLTRCIEDAERDAAAAAGIEEEDEGEELCNCEFSLAYGAKILLNNASLKLKRGRRYGLCGPNGVGKSTLMRAIANGQVDGFPPKDVLRTIYVEHDIDGCDAEMAVVEFVFNDPAIHDVATHEEVESMLTSVGFTKEMQQMPITSLSGGWKMKCALARAILMRADIMLLDEPTNHLDVTNVAWLENYLTGLKNVTSIIVSHDSGFLDHVCTDIIHYANRKLKIHRGNLSKFVETVPEARSYYTLEATMGTKFVLPEPTFLEGVKSKDRAVLKMHNVSFKYPGTDRVIFSGATLQCSMMSRVACIGANGAGKSTLIKVLTGETEPTTGTVWKHPNLRIAYVAQHAFHHIEQHLDKTPNEYIRWRYAVGEDREAISKVSRQVTAEEEKKMGQVHNIDGEKRKVDKILGRRKLKKDYEYEVQWVGLHPDQNTWINRDKLVEMGFEKMVNEVDAKEAARQGLISRPLTSKNVEKHLVDLGLEAEFATHSQMRGLSGGQKVKVVIAAAMWNQPHLLVLDEPTNYLDRESLGALASAIKDYGGGVIMITHHNEFSSALCPETWLVKDSLVNITGALNIPTGKGEKLELKLQEEVQDALGNTIKVKGPKKELSRKEKKAREKARKARRERGEEVSDSEDDQ